MGVQGPVKRVWDEPAPLPLVDIPRPRPIEKPVEPVEMPTPVEEPVPA